MEGEAILAILYKSKQNNDEIVGSPILDFEIDQINDIEKREKVKYFYVHTITRRIDYTLSIFKWAEGLSQRTNMRTLDVFHLSFAENSDVDIFLTTDVKLEKAGSKLNLKTKVINPIKYLMEVM